MKLKQLSTKFEYFTQKWLIFLTDSASNRSLYLHLIYELPLCKILYQYLDKYGKYKYFPISCDFFHKILTILPPKWQFLNLFSLAS